ncbi:Zinc finger CCCH domain-containing protein 7B Rotavirus 'X'-associated non-structural protein [Larimichthys crocea]|uniref:Zinc finger CCCH domain-containing protein 7B Rotavirus 'X'-associated non-structural protein n=1 Tax=Larimichthys crocea TaxID=215358 RepID=A0A6G0HZ83_LARCR|nr:Zinc finger CCCH domain-containing protein 7B Rotavirus 'X'-associated non-structural protein [Larimichthys crocea]
MDPDRQKRREEIQKAMSFIQRGQFLLRDGDWRQANQQYGEGISVARYAQAEALVIPHELLESLYVNRAAASYQTREYDRGVQDCDSALCVSEGSRRALYRKALCLREMGRLREAYECGTKCLLTAPHDRQVSDLAQDLANKLGLKVRKAYVSPQTESTATDGESHGETSPPTGEMSSNGLESLGTSDQCIPAPLATPIPVSDDPATPVVTPCTDLSESPSSQALPPMPYSVPVSEQMEECSSSVIKDELNSLLECMPKKVSESRVLSPPTSPTRQWVSGLRTPRLPAPSPQLPPAFFSSSISDMPPLESYSSLGQRDQGSTQAQDALGGFPTDGEGKAGVAAGGLDSLSEYTLPGGRVCHSFIPGMRNHNAAHANGPAGTNLSLLSRNPLAATHEFRQACHACYSRIGPRVMDYKYQPEAAHRCKRDVLLCRLKNTDDPTWKRIRPRPARNNFLGAFVLCKEVQERQECQYGENCTFAYCQEEIDVWTQERKGALSRELLFDPLGSTERRALSVTRLLQLHMGMFMFLCEECFDSKPRIISKRSKENLAVCSNLTARHPFDDNKCLVHVVRSANVRYSKVRPLHPLCQFDVCRHEVRYGCQREDSCSFAHSVIELKCWVLQQDTGITHEEMVQESKRHWQRLEQNAQKQQKPIHIPHPSSSIPVGVVGGMGGGGVAAEE